VVSESSGEVCKKLMMFYYFVPYVNRGLESHNMEFWFEVEDLKYSNENVQHKNQRKLKKDAVRIFKEYVSTNSPREINIDSDVRSEITIKLKSLAHTRVFDLAQLYVLNHLAALFREE
jgi:hypothetical protein